MRRTEALLNASGDLGGIMRGRRHIEASQMRDRMYLILYDMRDSNSLSSLGERLSQCGGSISFHMYARRV